MVHNNSYKGRYELVNKSAIREKVFIGEKVNQSAIREKKFIEKERQVKESYGRLWKAMAH